MLRQIDERLTETKKEVRNKQKLEAMLREAETVLREGRSTLAVHKAILQNEKQDVDKLDGFGLTGLFYSILGSKEEHLEKEKQEYLAAKLKHNEAAKAVEQTQRTIQDLRQELTTLGSPDAKHERLIDEKERLLKETGDQRAGQLLDFSERLADVEVDRKELREAIEAGQRAEYALQQVQSELRSAENWGTWDMLGGGALVTMAKHSRIDGARQKAHEAQQYLRRFRAELADADQRLNVSLDVGGFATFADYFFDGLIADWVMQSKIQNASSVCSSALSQVRSVLGVCRRRLAEAEQAIEEVVWQRQEFVEQA